MLKRKEFILGAAAALLIASGATAGGVINWPAGQAEARPGQVIPSAGAAGLAFAPPQGAPLSFADIVEQVAPAVVQIEVETPVERPRGGGGIQIPGFPGLVIPNPQGAEPDADAEPELARGAGSGFFISKDGFIVTNNHVVADATSIKVVMTDGRKLEARLVGRDVATDLAVIKVDGDDFKFVSFEEEATPRVGDWVVAVGNPFGLGGTATAGIVSASARDVPGTNGQFVDFLQIDAAINRGNSGGPTFDIYGRVIGVNSAIVSPTGGSVGIGFAIPASVAKPITDRLMTGQAVERGYLGVRMGTLTDELRGALGLADTVKGAFIDEVTPGGPAEKGGLKSEDVVVAINGQATETGNALSRIVASANTGDNLRIDLYRDGRRQTVTVRSGARPANLEQEDTSGDGPDASPSAPSVSGQTMEGMTVSPLSPALRNRYSIASDVVGVVITEVAPRSKAGQFNLRPGTVISTAFGRAVRTPDELKSAIDAARAAGRPSVLLRVHSGAQSARIPLELSKPE